MTDDNIHQLCKEKEKVMTMKNYFCIRTECWPMTPKFFPYLTAICNYVISNGGGVPDLRNIFNPDGTIPDHLLTDPVLPSSSGKIPDPVFSPSGEGLRILKDAGKRFPELKVSKIPHVRPI